MRAVDKSISMHYTIAQNIGIFQPRNSLKQLLLASPFEVCLKTDKIIHSSTTVILSKLNNRIIFHTRSFIYKSNRLHRPETKSVHASGCKHFYWKTRFKKLGIFFKFFEFYFWCSCKNTIKIFII